MQAARLPAARGVHRRQIHWVLSGAMERAVRWRWIAVSPTGSAQPPLPPAPKPSPPSAKEAARLLEEAWKDEAWGALVWLAMTTAARQGELCALRRRHLNLKEAVLTIESGVAGHAEPNAAPATEPPAWPARRGVDKRCEGGHAPSCRQTCDRSTSRWP